MDEFMDHLCWISTWPAIQCGHLGDIAPDKKNVFFVLSKKPTRGLHKGHNKKNIFIEET